MILRSSRAMAFASKIPIQIGRTRFPSISSRKTIAPLFARSNAKFFTFISINIKWASLLSFIDQLLMNDRKSSNVLKELKVVSLQ